MITPSAKTPPPNELGQQLELARSLLNLYARDLNLLVQRHRRQALELHAANQQLQAYARDLKRQFDTEKEKGQELEQAYRDFANRLVRASQYRDEETGAHIQRLSHYSKVLARSVGLGESEADMISAAAPMHDLGKIGVPGTILRKPGPLTPEEWEVMKSHTVIGANLLKGSSSPLLETAEVIALTHHERWDGTGYPQGLQGEGIPMAGRIVMLGDQYDALRTQRPYKPAFSHQKTCEILLYGDDRTRPEHFDPEVLQVFRKTHQEFEEIYRREAD